MKPLLYVLVILIQWFTVSAFAQQEVISISAVGDIMMGTDFPADFLPVDQGRGFFSQAAAFLNKSDIRFGNFEGTFFEGPPQPDGKVPGPNRYLFRTPIDYVERLTEAGFNVVSLANNHARDFGEAGIQSSKQTLQLAGIQYSSKNGEVAKFKIRGTSVALIAVDYYKGARSVVAPENTYQEVARLKQQGSLVIISAHVGREGSGAEHVRPGNEVFLGENRGDSIAFAHRAIDQGADLILMHGPHVPRALEMYRGHLIVYSLGNFTTGRGVDISGISGLAPLIQIELDLQGKLVQAQLVSFKQKRPEATLLDSQKDALQLVRRLSVQDFPQSAPQISNSGLITP
jgi:poly-gamma-glutamate capsule biosynthesis protein CapA/YwtB (metallophosphatase superfamily)